ncbi:serine O-acetyltransferase [Flavobacterium sp. '19STA2R22 D10 B1']|uniref:serine O-acetyltransferase n=1 Tax=Flavobacterium aerium TaxID=3037261 RepID=UPI00278BC778|nr:serine acetyltransferase [Flavobacterium sp. '19STA2R22 D10 B1']
MLNRIPHKKSIQKLINAVYTALFTTELLDKKQQQLNYSKVENRLSKLLPEDLLDKEAVLKKFQTELDQLKDTLLKDATFILESDPAANQLEEVIAIYPGFYAIVCHRVAHILVQYNIPYIPRMITEHAHQLTGIDIHPGATIGSPFSIDHGTGIVIGETSHIGNYVKMFQGVTLGALSVDKDKASKKRHPTIEDYVILYSGCSILGGETIVGAHSVIGGNVFLTNSIAANSVVYHKSEVVVRTQQNFHEPINFVI